MAKRRPLRYRGLSDRQIDRLQAILRVIGRLLRPIWNGVRRFLPWGWG